MTNPTSARTVSLPVTRVTCLEDRAQVERAGTLDLPAGRSRLRVDGVSRVAVDRSLTVEIQGATLAHARVVRQWKERPAGGLPADASALRRAVKELEHALVVLDDDAARHATRLEHVRATRADLLRAVSEGAGAGKTEVPSWRQNLELLRVEESRVLDDQRAAADSHRVAEGKLAQARQALRVGEQSVQSMETLLELTVDAPVAGAATFKVGYMVPCAVWRPAYRATLTRDPEGKDQVRLECEAVVWQRTGEDWQDVALAFSTARPTLGATPPVLADDRLVLRDKQEREKRTVEVAIREEVIQATGTVGDRTVTEMPGLDDGGEVQVLSSPAKATVPADGQPHRVPLSSFESAAATELACAPELSPLVSLVATFPNRGRHVLLAGPVDLVRGNGFVGRTLLKFAAVGEAVKLSFGSEDNLRAVREVHEKRDESRITGRRTTQRTVRLFLSNASGQACQVALDERILVSEVKEVEVTLLAKETVPAPREVSRDGIVRFLLDLPPRAQERVTLAYEISASGKVAGL
jgi:uncharacterized protein (TIGR02231 family)